jgi:single-strand DNA-binding protein
MNTIHILGRLGKDPETRQVGETSVTNFSVATTERYKDRHGNKQEKTQWHTVSFWGKQGEIIAQYFNKGDQIQVTGTMEYRKCRRKKALTANQRRNQRTVVQLHWRWQVRKRTPAIRKAESG